MERPPYWHLLLRLPVLSRQPCETEANDNQFAEGLSTRSTTTTSTAIFSVASRSPNCCDNASLNPGAGSSVATTFGGRPQLRETSVSLLGLRAPLGVFLTAWGGLTMLYSAPVDNWWHNAYGLDVRVASPPHILLLSGTAAVGLGTLLLAVAHLNRARSRSPTRRRRL